MGLGPMESEKKNLNVSSEKEFCNLMERIDEELRAAGVPIQGRPLRGALEVSGQHGLGLTLLPVADRPPRPGCYTGEDLVIRIFEWFDKRYGDQLLVDYSPGHTIVLVRGDIYRVRLPRIFGSAAFVCDPSAHGKNVYPVLTMGGQTATVNVLDSVEDLQPGLSQALEPQELQKIKEVVHLESLQFATIEALYNTELGRAAKADLRASVDRLLDSPPQFGQSRWASLQAAEKFLKAYLTEQGLRFPKTHDLKKLANLAHIRKYGGLPDGLLEPVQCDPGVRYDDSSTVDDAILAHRMACLICWKVAKTMAD